MITPNTEVCLSVIGLESIIGLCSSAFIILYLILTSIKERKATSCNCILICLSTSNLCFTVISSANFLISFVWPWLFSVPHVFYIIYYLTLCSTSSSSWLTASLCFFYFIKIRQFQPGFLAWVKVKIDSIVPWMILTVICVSQLGTYLLILIFYLDLPNNSTNAIASLSSEHHKRKLNLMKPTLILNALPFVVSLSSTSGSAWFLKHQRSAGKMGNSKVKDYRSAVHIMICLVSFYAFIYLFFTLYGLQIFAFNSWGYWMCLIAGYSFAAVQSGLIISGNPKLREAWRQLFHFRHLGGHGDH